MSVLVALVAHRALVRARALLRDVSGLAAVVALGTPGRPATGLVSSQANRALLLGLGAVASEVVATAVVALLGLRLTARRAGVARSSVGALGGDVARLAAVEADTGGLLGLLLGAVTAEVPRV